MKLLKEIYRSPGVNPGGRTITREAVRGIILADHQLLMVFSPVNLDYKFPGGGVIPGESHQAALNREVREESGAVLLSIDHAFGKVVEYDHPLEPDFEVFKMTSYYYFCTVDAEFGTQNLDPYEADLGFRPCWVSLEDAIRQNQALLHQNPPSLPRWTRRETFVLNLIKKALK